MSESLSLPLARRIALAAQGIGRPVPATSPTRRRLAAEIGRLGLLQIDSVNVFERSHYLPIFARLGAFDRTALDDILLEPAGRHRGEFTEYWAHEAAFIPWSTRSLFHFRMAARRERAYADPHGWAGSNGAMLDWLRAELAHKGPLPASKIQHDAAERRGPWWGWSDVKIGLEHLFAWGEVFTTGRERFERHYALTEQWAPGAATADTEASAADSIRELVRISAVALGIGTARDIGDYFRLSAAQTSPAIADLVDSGELIPVTVGASKGAPKGARGAAAPQYYLHRDARRPRRIETTALLSPFDPVVWFRPRAERLFDFHYRIEIYTPEPKRVYGYYVLPLLIDGAVVGRVDLKSDRQSRTLLVQSAWQEPGAPADTSDRLAELLERTAAWQGLDGVLWRDKGTLPRPGGVASDR